MLPNTEADFCNRKQIEREYATRYFAHLEREARAQKEQEHQRWVTALAHSYRKPF